MLAVNVAMLSKVLHSTGSCTHTDTLRQEPYSGRVRHIGFSQSDRGNMVLDSEHLECEARYRGKEHILMFYSLLLRKCFIIGILVSLSHRHLPPTHRLSVRHRSRSACQASATSAKRLYLLSRLTQDEHEISRTSAPSSSSSPPPGRPPRARPSGVRQTGSPP